MAALAIRPAMMQCGTIVIDERQMNSGQARLPLRIVLASMVGMWLCYFLLITLRGSIVELEMQNELLWRRGLVSLAGVGITFLLWLAIRFVEGRSLALKVVVALIAALPASLAIAQVNQWVFAPIQDEMAQRMAKKQDALVYRDESGNLLIDVPARRSVEIEGQPAANEPPADRATFVLAPAPTGLDRWRQITDIAIGRYFLLLAWAALYLAMLAGAQARLAERRAGEFRNAAKASELRSLRYQVNPHFLFNALNSLSAMVMTGKGEKAEEMIQTISSFYRHSLTDSPTADVALEDEFDLQRHYLEIEAVRFPERLRTVFQLPAELAGCQVPGMILQPLVENSVKYGVSASSQPVTITLEAREEYGRLVLTVSDDGPGETKGPAMPSANGFGIGLANVRDRLNARFGDEASVTSGPGLSGYETELRIPLLRHG